MYIFNKKKKRNCNNCGKQLNLNNQIYENYCDKDCKSSYEIKYNIL